MFFFIKITKLATIKLQEKNITQETRDDRKNLISN